MEYNLNLDPNEILGWVGTVVLTVLGVCVGLVAVGLTLRLMFYLVFGA
jgi:hypothetical protein